MRVCVITQCELARSHGTGAQLLAMLGEWNVDYYHFYWLCGHGARSETPRSQLLEDYEIRIPYSRRLMRHLKLWTGTNWWRGDEINAAKLRRFLRANHLKFDAAYVVVGREGDARRASSMLKALGCRYVLHLMDILHDDGLSWSHTPALGRLIAEADELIALTPPIKAEMERFSRRPIRQILIGQRASDETATAPMAGKAIRLLMGGRPYAEGCRLLIAAYPELSRLNPRPELLHLGPHFGDLPATLQKVVRDMGFISDEAAYRRTVAGAHLAFLSGPGTLDSHGRFSFPSRCADFLMAGLPVLACVPEGSATQAMLAQLMPCSVTMTTRVDQLIREIKRLTATPMVWNYASTAARRFAVEKLSIETVSRETLRVLGLAAKRPQAPHTASDRCRECV